MSQQHTSQFSMQKLENFFRQNSHSIAAGNVNEFYEDYAQAHQQVTNRYAGAEIGMGAVAAMSVVVALCGASRGNHVAFLLSSALALVTTFGFYCCNQQRHKINDRYDNKEVDIELVEAFRPINDERAARNKLRDPHPGKVIHLFDGR